MTPCDDKAKQVEVKVNRHVSFENPGHVVVRQGDSTGWLNCITEADPVTKFSPFVLKSVLDAHPVWPNEIIRLTPPGEGTVPHLCTVPDGEPCFQDWKVECIGANQSFTYIIKHYDWQRHSWIGAWPD